MKITKQALQQIIKEELENTELNEFGERARKRQAIVTGKPIISYSF